MTYSKPVTRVLARVAGVLAILYVALLVAVYATMRQPPQRFGRIMRHVPIPVLIVVPVQTLWNIARGGDVGIGDPAPDFTLPRSDKTGDVRLSALRGRPVVLVFGSYT